MKQYDNIIFWDWVQGEMYFIRNITNGKILVSLGVNEVNADAHNVGRLGVRLLTSDIEENKNFKINIDIYFFLFNIRFVS